MYRVRHRRLLQLNVCVFPIRGPLLFTGYGGNEDISKDGRDVQGNGSRDVEGR